MIKFSEVFMTSFYANAIDNIKTAAQNPFGLDFEIHHHQIYILDYSNRTLIQHDWRFPPLWIFRGIFSIFVLAFANILRQY